MATSLEAPPRKAARTHALAICEQRNFHKE
jgi:hypothetical protein